MLTHHLFRALRAALLVLACLYMASPAFAQTEPTATQKLDAARAELDQIGIALRRDRLTDADLIARRQDLEPLAATAAEVIERVSPAYDSIKARLEQLGPVDEKDKEKSAAVESERAEQQRLFTQVDGVLKRARALSLEVDQARQFIASRRRAIFTGALFQRSSSLLAPDLWAAVISETPRAAKAITLVASDWLSAASSRLERWRAVWFAAVLAAIGIFYIAATKLAKRVLRRAPDVTEPTRLQKAVAALWVGFVTAVVPILAAVAIAQTLRSFDLVNARLEPLLQALVETVRRLAWAAGLVRGLLAPLRPTWRLFDFGDVVAGRLAGLAMGLVGIVSLMKIVEALNELIGVALLVSVAVRGVCALAVALLMIFSLHGIAGPPEVEDDCLGPRIEPPRDWYGPLRFLAWVAITVILGSVLIGYVAFGAFITEQLVWVGFIGCLAYLLIVLANEGFEVALRPPAAIARAVMSSLGMRRESLQQLAVLLAGVTSVCVVVTAILLILAPWGIESDDMLTNFRSAFFGFKIGDVTISLSSIALALVFFAAALFATRTVQRWLERKLLPHTQLDTGLRNSIRTSIGYVGFVVAAAVGFGTLGLSFEKLAIVAGALSVGIGFGLQSIVNNFVSGLILLWERAIRVGDWVVVGDEQGHVRRINVRSTEIETFDRATMIVPNSNLVTGVVKNWVRGDKVGRIKIPVAVNLVADPEKVRETLIETAKAHELVERIPAPNVMFISMSETLLKFEL
ncbi:MAG: MscS Mechanosensitive ion channel, partial [Hyphomicrobiales bacterium]|nr:MscS Mechanosensitive ion channel [Hyphomicrobiales bacterium]